MEKQKEQEFLAYDIILNSTHYGLIGLERVPITWYTGRGCSNYEDMPRYGQVPDYSDEERKKAKQGLMEIAENESLSEEIRERAYIMAGKISEKTLTQRLINQILPKAITRKIFIPENGDGHSHSDSFSEVNKTIGYKYDFPKKTRKAARNQLIGIIDTTKDKTRQEHIQESLKQADFLNQEIIGKKIINFIKFSVGIGVAYLLYRGCTR